MENNTMDDSECVGTEEPQMPQIMKMQCPDTCDEPADDVDEASCMKQVPEKHEDASNTEAWTAYEAVDASVASTVAADQQEGGSDDEDKEAYDDGDDYDDDDDHHEQAEGPVEYSGHHDNEVERHDAISTETTFSQTAMLEASRTALFRRYSRMTPTEQERSFHEEALHEPTVLAHGPLCPEPIAKNCNNPACADQIQWRDARIAELQAALDHMTEAMAIQQRDMATQRVFLSRQAEQLTHLSNKLHQEKVALHVERERFQQSIAFTPMTIANKLKPAAGKLKSPVKKLLSAATNRRASFTTVSSASGGELLSSSASAMSMDPISRSRQNPLFSDSSTAPLTDRSSSLSALEFKTASLQGAIAVTPPKASLIRLAPLAVDPVMVDIMLNDGLSPPKSRPSTGHAESPTAIQHTDDSKRDDRQDSASSLTLDQKKLSIGDRFRSIRWGRS